ncbi:MAG TPA: hypothetical protein VGC00_11925 [Thermoanaerobaculia bacterium]
MSTEPCAREATLLAALRRGRLSADDEAHLDGCASCALAADAERWMATAVARLGPAALPSAGSLLLRAQVRARRDAAERSLRPLATWRRIALVGGAALILFALARGGDFLAGLWTASPTPAEALLAAGLVTLAALPAWLRWRRETA